MVKSKDGKTEIISIEEDKWRKHKEDFLAMIESYKTQIELALNSVEYCEKKIKEYSKKL